MQNTSFTNCVDSLVRISEDSKLAHEEYENFMPRERWLKDMCTLSLTFPRCVGKTSYINKRASCADMIIVHNHAMKQQYKGSAATVVTIPELDMLVRGRQKRGFNRVYVDEPGFVFSRDFPVERLYHFFNGTFACANMFIMLGT